MAGQAAPHILIVEDEFLIRDALTEFLEEEGYSVAGAANGQEALSYLRRGTLPSLILHSRRSRWYCCRRIATARKKFFPPRQSNTWKSRFG
jgi:DNA-binding response OmpR family regulator